MNEARRARVRAVADWFLEVSALLAVFPLLDSLLGSPGRTGWVAGCGLVFAAVTGFLGLYLISKGEKP